MSCALCQYSALVDDAVAFGKAATDVSDDEKMALTLDRLAVNFGKEILKVVPGYVSTEVDARLRCACLRVEACV